MKKTWYSDRCEETTELKQGDMIRSNGTGFIYLVVNKENDVIKENLVCIHAYDVECVGRLLPSTSIDGYELYYGTVTLEG